jgi:hypothetical protein
VSDRKPKDDRVRGIRKVIGEDLLQRQASIGLVRCTLPPAAQDHAGQAVEFAGLLQLTQEAINPVGCFVHVFQE